MISTMQQNFLKIKEMLIKTSGTIKTTEQQ